MWKLYHKLFGWDYVQWRNFADQGVARVYLDGTGNAYYWRYSHTRLLDVIARPEQVVWLTCHPGKYMKTSG